MKVLKILLAAALVFTISCGGGETSNSSSNKSQAAKSSSGSELTEFQLKHGIGPITSEVTIGELDAETVANGQKLFVQYCSACHKVDERYIGPKMTDAVGRRTPTYLMNMIMNPEEMTKKHPDAQALLREFLAPMPNQNLTRDEARAVVEYLISEANQ